MPRPAFTLRLLPAVLVALAALLAPLAASGTGAVTGTATSATARAAQRVEQPAAQRFDLDGPVFQSARQVAEAHWGAPACKGQIAISWKPMQRGINATATWRNPTDAWNNPAENFDCIVELNTNADYDFAKLCSVLAHELGHLHGRPHAEQPGELMSALYSEPTPACWQAAPPTPADEAAELEADTALAPGTDATASVDRPAARKRSVKRTSLRKGAFGKRGCVRAMKSSKRAKGKRACTRVARQAKRSAATRS